MADEVGKVSFGIEANFDGKGIDQATQGLTNLGKIAGQSKDSLISLGDAASVASGVLGADLVKAVANAAVKVATFAFTVTETASKVVESMDFMAQATGVTLQEFQQLEPVMRRNNVSAEQMGMIFRLLAKNIQEAKDPTSKAGKAFEELGLSLTGLESPSQVLTLIAQRISKLPDGFQKTRLESELLGRSGSQLTRILNEGAAGFKKSSDEALKMGNVLSDQANKAILEVNDSFDNLDLAQENLRKHLSVLFAPMVQGVNEAQLSLINLASVMVDDMTVATRTLYVRLQALFGFLKEQAQLSILEIGKIPEIFNKWDTWATSQIEAIRKQGVAAKELSKSVGDVDEKTQALARSQAKAWMQSSLGLMQLDIGWKIVQHEIDAYRKAEEGLGRYTSTQLITAYQDLQKASSLWAKSDHDAAVRNIEQFKAMEAQYRATAAASNQAALASGKITPVEFQERGGSLALKAIDDEIKAQGERLEAARVFHEANLALAANDANRQRELIQEQLAVEQQTHDAISVLSERRKTQEINNDAAIEQAHRNTNATNLAAATSLANSELAILQATYAETDQIRAARLAAIQAQYNQEIAQVGLTEQQKLAIYRNAEAQRIGIAQQFPTFFQKQMQDLVAGNAFSLAQISTNFTNATAQWIVTGQGFKQFWTQLQVTIVQTFLNSLIQMAAKWILHTSMMEAASTAFEAAKTAIFGTGEAARLGISVATNKAISLSVIASIASMVALGEGAVAIMTAVMGTASAMIGAIAAALDAGIITAELSQPVWAASADLAIGAPTMAAAGSAAIQTAAGAAIVAAGISAFAKGGIVNGPTLGMIGEAGTSEAVIPLNARGAGFMADMLGLGVRGGYGSGQTTIIVELDGKPIMKHVANNLPSMLRLKGLPA